MRIKVRFKKFGSHLLEKPVHLLLPTRREFCYIRHKKNKKTHKGMEIRKKKMEAFRVNKHIQSTTIK